MLRGFESFNYRALQGWLAAVCFLATAGSASAYTISTIGTGGNPEQDIYQVSGLVQGDSVDVSWSLSGLGYPDLAASGFITVKSLSATTLVLDIALSNDTLAAEGLSAVLTVFGLAVVGVDPGNPGNMLSSPGSNFDTYDEGNIAGNLVVDVCASTNNSCNHGQPRFGIAIGESDFFQMTLQGDFDTSDLTLAVFGIKWQTNGDSYEQPGVPNLPIPEPSTVSLMSLGLVALGVAQRRHLG